MSSRCATGSEAGVHAGGANGGGEPARGGAKPPVAQPHSSRTRARMSSPQAAAHLVVLATKVFAEGGEFRSLVRLTSAAISRCDSSFDEMREKIA
eukprot:3656239-Prymnesium_polylepis.1